jgi:hypothetical protein
MFQKFLIIIVLIAGLNCAYAQTTLWNASDLAATITHIKKVTPKEGDSWKFKLDAQESIILSESAGEQILTVTTRQWSATIFVSEKKEFKGNIATLVMEPMELYGGDSLYLPKDYRYFFRLTSDEKTNITQKIEQYLKIFSTKKPGLWVTPRVTPTKSATTSTPVEKGLFEGSDALTQEFVTFINFLKKNGKIEEDEYVWEKGELTISWQPQLHYLFVFIGENSKGVFFDAKKHVLQADLYYNDDEKKQITEKELKDIFSLIK